MTHLTVAALFLWVALLFATVLAGNGPLRHVVASGTPYQAGFQVGQAMRDIIASRLNEPDIVELIAWGSQSELALEVNRSLYEASVAAAPFAVEEIRGISDGARQPFALVWFLNIHVEIQSLQAELWPNNSSGSSAGNSDSRRTSHCTDVFAARSLNERVWGHNEDGSNNDQNHTYMVTMHVTDENTGETLDNYTSFAYAGSLGGGSFAWNAWGLIFSVNSLFSDSSNYQTGDLSVLPQRILHRVGFRQKTLNGITNTILQYQTCTSFSLNVGLWNSEVVEGRASFLNIETDPLGGFSVRRYDPPVLGNGVVRRHRLGLTEAPVISPTRHMYHGNLYEALIVAQSSDPSTVARLARLTEMGVPTTPRDVIEHLGDTENEEYPVYRTWRVSDPVDTLATVIYHLDKREVHVYVGNPKFTTPIFVFANITLI